GKIADALVLANVGRGLTEDKRLALAGKEQAQEQLDGSRFPRSVRTEQAEDFAAIDAQIEGAERGFLLAAPEVAVNLCQLMSLNNCVLGHERPPLSVASAP